LCKTKRDFLLFQTFFPIVVEHFLQYGATDVISIFDQFVKVGKNCLNIVWYKIFLNETEKNSQEMQKSGAMGLA
jgi:hypothetical protein